MALDDFRLYFYCFTNVCTQWVSQVFTIISNPRTPWNQCLSSGPQSVLWVLTHGLSLAAAPRFSSAVLMGKLLGFTEGLRNKKCETKGGKTVGCPASLGIGSCDEMSRISFLVKFQVLAPLLAQAPEDAQDEHLRTPPSPGHGLRLFQQGTGSIYKPLQTPASGID